MYVFIRLSFQGGESNVFPAVCPKNKGNFPSGKPFDRERELLHASLYTIKIATQYTWGSETLKNARVISYPVQFQMKSDF
ncbi:hypothetical protein Barb4_00890 [Bacteroidales bacterium Barb4]|nr:hypothetical protein Barb4_00890 [Bacteroidales bacterium Barb4]